MSLNGDTPHSDHSVTLRPDRSNQDEKRSLHRLLGSAMGFHAPSSEDVYRYLLRLDEEDRSLTDQFSWSMLLASDYSPICQEFLSTFCLDLCARTADRVRFVFFSDIPEEEFETLTFTKLFNRRRRMGGSTVLGWALETLGSRSGNMRVDFERDGWRDLRPTALRPFSDVAQIGLFEVTVTGVASLIGNLG